MLTVVTPATSRRLTTVDHVREDLGLSEAEVSTAKVERLIDQASSAIETYCRTVFARETVEETWRSGARGTLLSRGPVSSIVSVSQDSVALPVDGYVLDAGWLYPWNGTSRTIWRGKNMTARYVAGYILPGEADANLPAVIEQACIGEISAALSRRSRDPLIRSESEDGVGSTSWQMMVGVGPLTHPDSAGLLDEFRMVSL